MSATSRSIYPEANIEHLKRQAKDLQRDLAAGNDDAISRVRTHLSGRESSTNVQLADLHLSLRDAQHVVALEYGFTSWGDLRGWHRSASSDLWRRITKTRDGRVTDLRGILEALHVTHAQMLMSSMSRHFARPIRVEIAYVDVTTYGEYVAAVSLPCCGWVFEADGLGAPACLDIGMPIVMRLLSRGEWDTVPLSRAEVTTIEPMARQLLEDLQVTFQPAGDIALKEICYHGDARDMAVSHDHDIIYLVGYEVGEATAFSDETWGILSLAYPITSVTALLEGVQESARAT
jgi:hypothetical protein